VRLASLASPNSPLRLAPNDIVVTRAFVENRLPITFINCPDNGAITPISIAGTLVVTMAECPAFGAPEGVLVTAGAAQIMRYYGIPSYASIVISETIGIDAQTGWEIAWTAQLSMMAGINLVNGIGTIGACDGCSLEKLVIDNEVLGGLQRILKGIEVSETSVVVEVIEDVGPGSHYLGHKL